jgi:hypothetical protein
MQRLVHLASLREAVLSQLSQLDGVKAALTEKKVLQQGRLLAALDARLAAALAAVDPHRWAAPCSLTDMDVGMFHSSRPEHTPAFALLGG